MEISIVTSVQLCLCMHLVSSNCCPKSCGHLRERRSDVIVTLQVGYLHLTAAGHGDCAIVAVTRLLRVAAEWTQTLSSLILHSSECRLEQRSGGQRTDSFGLVTMTIDSIKHMRREISSISSVACLLAQPDFYLDTLFLLRMVYTHICAVAILPHLHVGWWNILGEICIIEWCTM